MSDSVVILHGWNSQVSRWDRLANCFKKNDLKVYVPALPGFDCGPKIKKPWGLKDYVKWVKTYFKQNQIKNPVLVCHSFGGRLGLLLANDDQVKVKALVLAAAAGVKPKFSFKKSIFLILAKIGKLAFWLPPLRWFKKPARFVLYKLAREKDYYQAKGYLRQTMVKVIARDLTDQLSLIKQPTLILWGKYDQATPLQDGKLMNQKIANSKLKIYKGGHTFVFKKAHFICKTIISFINSI